MTTSRCVESVSRCEMCFVWVFPIYGCAYTHAPTDRIFVGVVHHHSAKRVKNLHVIKSNVIFKVVCRAHLSQSQL